ncbi:hypothetical protein J5N97_010397 [Dioscorea zingiberensis]|uniref:F-box domain-containing protein n=1 Tax=Dioscorea zingiberensis TaxID=325984 RepID=A0A9D5HNK5_9LILI|nr:hypothetical protein J5N97_010397 [Dioscorea zingiberensis]
MEAPKKPHAANNLANDLLISILTRLPPKSLCRFLCVSKSWHRLISDTYFQAQLPPSMAGLFYHFKDQDPSHCWRINKEYISTLSYHSGFIDTTLSFLPYTGKIQILDSCNGLLLCRLWGSPSSNVFICNPAAQSWTLIPNLKLPNFYSLFLAFDPQVSVHFTLVRLQPNRQSPCLELEKFSSQTHSWAKFQVSTEHDINFLRKCRGVYFNGILHLLAARKYIVAIDLESMVCRRIEMPGTTSLIRTGLLGKSGGSLHYAVKEKREMKVWMLKDYERGEWVSKHRVRLEVLFYILGFHPDMDIVFLRVQNILMSYHMNTGELKEVHTLRQRPIQYWSFVFSPFFGEDALANKNGV